MWCRWEKDSPEYYGWKDGYSLGKEDSKRDDPYNPDVENRCIIQSTYQIGVPKEELYTEHFWKCCEKYAFGWKTGYADGYTVIAGRKILEQKRKEEIAKAEEAAKAIKRQNRKDFLLFCLKVSMLILLVLFCIYCPPLWEM